MKRKEIIVFLLLGLVFCLIMLLITSKLSNNNIFILKENCSVSEYLKPVNDSDEASEEFLSFIGCNMIDVEEKGEFLGLWRRRSGGKVEVSINFKDFNCTNDLNNLLKDSEEYNRLKASKFYSWKRVCYPMKIPCERVNGKDYYCKEDEAIGGW